MEILYRVLEIINYIFVGIASLGFLFQIIYIFFIFLKPKKFPHSQKLNRYAIIIPASNEEEVIAKTVRNILDNQTYPREYYDVYVIAHNSRDHTKENALKAGAIVYELNDDNPKHRRVSYAMKFICQKLLALNKYDAFIRFDADNLPKNDYIEKMNDAYNAGVKVARGYEASSNLTQNVWTKVSGTYYMRDSRIPSNFRERAHLDAMLTSAGMLCDMKIIQDNQGWQAMSASEDAEFTIDCLIKKERVHYVADAIVYEDQPSTLKDNFNRLKRMGHGLNLLFWKKGFKMFFNFFRTGRFSNIDLFMQLFFIPVALICCLWFPIYYIFYAIIHLINAFGNNFMATFMSDEDSINQLINLAYMVALVLGVYYIGYTLQTYLACLLSKKHLGLTTLKGMYAGIFLSPLFMIIWAIGISIGIVTKPKWKKIHRNV